jgi:hypothetical protein
MQRYTVYFIWKLGSTCFGWYFHPSSGAQTTVSTESSMCQTVTGICRYRGRVGTGLSVLSHTQTSSKSCQQYIVKRNDLILCTPLNGSNYICTFIL